ncbi:MAG: lytic murein transglycosylase [Gammaproteobacteria bacterium]|nr:lytic murein transglycosylase [Gammaproteobacteria bacterium]MDP2141952.1 lytic murein transglycosylase [Gammaproteobacteria bacterium]MDP2347166.1 lytic murein transglycosylase [Gammaproteobacteria bacterium]
MQTARTAVCSILLALLSLTITVRTYAQEPQIDFQEWLSALITEAREQGIREEIIEQALIPVTPIPQVITNDRNQAEFTETFEQYLEKRVTQWRVDTGRARLQRHRELLERVGEHYGVEPRFIVAFWGVETNYGNFTGGTDVIRALVTLAYDPRRAAYFRRELLSALQILNEGHITHADMKGSWAGAMGQSQFMPSSFLQYAQDFDGDGKRDIWGSEADVFASIAHYLNGAEWSSEQTWGREVQLPADYHARAEQWRQPPAEHSCSVVRHHTVSLPLSEWQAIGVRRADGSDLPTNDLLASIILPDGESGRAFLTYGNFRSILRYNCANNYALSIGYLADSFIGY